jgi:hypothetical protein
MATSKEHHTEKSSSSTMDQDESSWLVRGLQALIRGPLRAVLDGYIIATSLKHQAHTSGGELPINNMAGLHHTAYIAGEKRFEARENKPIQGLTHMHPGKTEIVPQWVLIQSSGAGSKEPSQSQHQKYGTHAQLLEAIGKSYDSNYRYPDPSKLQQEPELPEHKCITGMALVDSESCWNQDKNEWEYVSSEMKYMEEHSDEFDKELNMWVVKSSTTKVYYYTHQHILRFHQPLKYESSSAQK